MSLTLLHLPSGQMCLRERERDEESVCVCDVALRKRDGQENKCERINDKKNERERGREKIDTLKDRKRFKSRKKKKDKEKQAKKERLVKERQKKEGERKRECGGR